jgi:hypothetical protein
VDAADEVAELFREDRGVVDVGLGKQEEKLLSPVAADQIGRSQVRPDGLRHTAQDDVARSVSVRVVDLLEMVDVHEGDTERPTVTARTVDLGEERCEQGLATCDARQAIDGRCVVLGEDRRRDPVDGPPEATLQAMAVRFDRRLELARGESFRGNHEPREPCTLIEHDHDGRQHDAQAGAAHGDDHRSRAFVEQALDDVEPTERSACDEGRHDEGEPPEESHRLEA